METTTTSHPETIAARAYWSSGMEPRLVTLNKQTRQIYTLFGPEWNVNRIRTYMQDPTSSLVTESELGCIAGRASSISSVLMRGEEGAFCYDGIKNTLATIAQFRETPFSVDVEATRWEEITTMLRTSPPRRTMYAQAYFLNRLEALLALQERSVPLLEADTNTFL